MSTAAANAVAVRDLVKRYGSHTAVGGVSFDVPSGRFFRRDPRRPRHARAR